MRYFLTKRGTLANVRFSVFCPIWRLADLVRTVSRHGCFCDLRQYVVKPCLKDGSVVSFLLQCPITSSDSPDEVRDILMKDYGAMRYHIDSVITPHEVSLDDLVDNDDLPF